MSSDVILTEDLLIEKIQNAGLRVTLPRRAIVRALLASPESFISAQMIMDQVSADTGQVEASTVYRTLEDLGRIGLVHHIHHGNGVPGTWRLTVNHDHEHLVCENCGKTIEVPHGEFAPLYQVLRETYGFQTNPHHFTFLGYCDSCDPQTGHPHPHGTRQEGKASPA
jgi:Fur family ferric uptake transcriptional regulator